MIEKDANIIRLSGTLPPPTPSGTRHNVAMLKGSLFTKGTTLGDVREAALQRGLRMPHWEIAPLMCMRFSEEELQKMASCDALVMHARMSVKDDYPQLCVHVPLLQLCRATGNNALKWSNIAKDAFIFAGA